MIAVTMGIVRVAAETTTPAVEVSVTITSTGC